MCKEKGKRELIQNERKYLHGSKARSKENSQRWPSQSITISRHLNRGRRQGNDTLASAGFLYKPNQQNNMTSKEKDELKWKGVFFRVQICDKQLKKTRLAQVCGNDLKCKSQQRGEWKFTDNDRLGRLVNAGTLSSAYITTRCIQWWLPGNKMKQLKSISDAFLNCTYNCKSIFEAMLNEGQGTFLGITTSKKIDKGFFS